MIIFLSIIFNINVLTYQNETENFDFDKKSIFIYVSDPYCHQCLDNLGELFKDENVNIVYFIENLESYSTKAGIFTRVDKIFSQKELFFTNEKSDELNVANPFVEIIFKNKSRIFDYNEIFDKELSNSIKPEVILELKENYGFKLSE